MIKTYPIRKGGETVNRVGRLYIMFAGHGVPNPVTRDGQSLFCCHDYDPDKSYATSYPLTELRNKVQRIGIKHQILHLDCCHAGGIFLTGRARKADFVLARMAADPTVCAITAVKGDEQAIEWGGNGLFTKLICELLSKGFSTSGTRAVRLHQLASRA